MKLLFLHIGDIHTKDESAICQFQIRKIASALNSLSWDRLVICIAGDLSFSGIAKEYSVVKKMIGQLIKSVCEECNHSEWINVICVPGNHDVDHSIESLTSNDLQKILRENSYENHINSELTKEKEFYNLAKKYHCFEDGKPFYRVELQFDNYRVEFNLINSAIFSSLEEDKGLHYLPDQYIRRIKEPSDADFVISMMHHSPDWYMDAQKNRLEEAVYDKSSIVMFGHEHYNTKKTVALENGREAYIQAGGCLCNNSNWVDSTFHAGVLDTNDNSYKHSKFVWNEKQQQYESQENETRALPFKPSRERQLDFTKEYRDYLVIDEKRDISRDFQDYFVFPRLEVDEQKGNTREIVSETSFLDEIDTNKRIVISGGYNSGKTMLLKRLTLVLQKKYAVIFCRLTDIKNKKSDRIVKSKFQEMYGDSKSDYDRFLQLPKDKRVLIIDDIDQINKIDLDKFLSDQSVLFEHFILSTKQIIDMNILERMKAQLKTTDTILEYKIAPLFADKRQEIIKKVVEIKVDDSTSSQQIVELLNDTITAQKNFISLDPDFVIKYVEYYCNNIGEASSIDSTVFSKVFEANITTSLSKYQTSKLSVDKVYVILSKIAYFIHFHKAYPVNESEIIAIVNEYNDNYGTYVNPDELLSVIQKAKIIFKSEIEQGYRFTNKNYLAYFVARELNRKYYETGDDSDLRLVLHSACFGINADILMFLSYITDNNRILKLILEMANCYTNNWIEFDFDENCPDFLKPERFHEVVLPESSESETKNVVQSEKETEERLKTIDIYDYSDDEADQMGNNIIRSLQLMLIISRCFPVFEHSMLKEDKNAFVSTIYSIPNKIFSAWASIVNQEIDGILQFFKEQSKDYYRRQKEVTDSDIIKALQWSSMSFLLDLYNLAAFSSTKAQTIDYLNSFSYKSKKTYSLEHLMMLERQSAAKAFLDEAFRLSVEKRVSIYSTMLTRIIGHALVHKKELDLNQRNQLQSKFFPDSKNQKMILVQRSQIQKKGE